MQKLGGGLGGPKGEHFFTPVSKKLWRWLIFVPIVGRQNLHNFWLQAMLGIDSGSDITGLLLSVDE